MSVDDPDVLKFPEQKSDGIPERIPITPQIKKMIEEEKQIIPSGDRDYERQKDGSYRRITAPVDWRQRAIKAEQFFLGLVEERKKIQNLLLEACLKLESYGFKCQAGDLTSCKEFCEIKAFARGVPHIVRPPLEAMALDGTRLVKKILVGKEESEVFLECGHVIKLSMQALRALGNVKPGFRMACDPCSAVLKERGMYAEKKV